MTRPKNNAIENRVQRRPKVSQADPETKAIIERLAKAAEGKPEAAVGVRVQWVFQNIPKNWPDISEDSVPDPGSVSLLLWAKDAPGNFYQTYDVRFLPSKTEVDRSAMSRGSTADLDRVDAILDQALEKPESVCQRCQEKEAQLTGRA